MCLATGVEPLFGVCTSYSPTRLTHHLLLWTLLSSSPGPHSTYSSKLCGVCGNYDGDSSNDNQKPDGRPARDEEELGNSWQTTEDEEEE